jgi:hypothetical protein
VTYEQAVALRAHQLQGLRVDPQALEQAMHMIQHSRPPRRTKTPHKGCVQVIRANDEDLPQVTTEAEAQIETTTQQAWENLEQRE